METNDLNHKWDLSPAEATELQKRLADMAVLENDIGDVHTVAGLDVGYTADSGGDLALAAVALLSFPDLKLLEYSVARERATFPYVPGLFSFREGPAVLKALAGLSRRPDLLIFDGQGRAHPRRLGLASHLGLLTDIPSIGCAKTRLLGEYEPPGPNKGDYSELIDQGEIIGAVLRTRDNVNPLFISQGHRLDLKTCMDFVLRCCDGFRQPETTRWADRIAAGETP